MLTRLQLTGDSLREQMLRKLSPLGPTQRVMDRITTDRRALAPAGAFDLRAREETRESRGMPCLFLNTERVLGGKPPQNRGFVGILRGQKCLKRGQKCLKRRFSRRSPVGEWSRGARREIAAIFTARDDPMVSRAASAALARLEFVRAIRPRRTTHSSSATALIASSTAALGVSRSSRNKLGRASARPIRPSAQAASLATVRSASSSSSPSTGMTAGEGRAQRQPLARIADL